MKDYLTDLEVVKIEAFNSDTDMVEAVKKVLLAQLYSQGVIKKGEPHDPFKNRAIALVANGDVSDNELGSRLRAWWEGINALKEGFSILKNIKSKKEVIETPYNEAE